MAPALLFSAIVSTVYGALFHFWRGGSLRRLGLFLVAAWIGFGAGQVAGRLIGWNLGMVGDVHLIEATLGSLIALIVVNRPTA